MDTTEPKVEILVLDAGPLLSLSPLRGLAKRYITVPQVIEELKDKRAREHFEQLALTSGINVEVKHPGALALAKVTAFAKKTGDYSVLSTADLCVLALTYGLHKEEEEKSPKGPSPSADPELNQKTEEPKTETPPPDEETLLSTRVEDLSISSEQHTGDDTEPIAGPSSLPDRLDPAEGVPDTTIPDVLAEEGSSLPSPEHVLEEGQPRPAEPTPPVDPHNSDSDSGSDAPLYEDPTDPDDGEGEWITPSNVAVHKSRALSLLPSAAGKQGKEEESLKVACMTADYAMQNVLLHMGLNLVGVEGKKIKSVKSWVLRCHACFKICKDPSKKFCPSCGNPTLLRTTVTTTSATDGSEPKVQIHLKKNFQYHNRGTIYSIPAPKPGTSKRGAAGKGLILREDQVEFQRGVMREEGRQRKEERKLANAMAAAAQNKRDGKGEKIWAADPDWIPEMLLGKATRRDGGLPTVGYGRKNPNERRKTKK